MPSLSILTPTWNRAGLLPRVHAGLVSQSCRDFEWIVADDGSTDGTADVVRSLAARSDFPILYLQVQAHVGKARMDNEAARRARAGLLLWCDSDDMLVPDAVEAFLSAWHSLSPDEAADFSGVTALAATAEGVLANPFSDGRIRDVSWNDIAGLHRITSDMTYMVRTDLMRANPFPEVDLVVPESAVWNVIGHMNARFIPKVLLVKQYRAPNAVSFTGRMNYNRGRAHAAAVRQRELGIYPERSGTRYWRLLTYLRYCIHGELQWKDARRLWGNNSNSLEFWAAAPLGYALSLVDRLRRKVERSHREFIANQDAPVSATWLNC